MTEFTKTEWHSVASEFKYDCPDEAIIEEFGSVKRFKEILTHQDQETFGGMEPEGEAPTDEESDKFYDKYYSRQMKTSIGNVNSGHSVPKN